MSITEHEIVTRSCREVIVYKIGFTKFILQVKLFTFIQ